MKYILIFLFGLVFSNNIFAQRDCDCADRLYNLMLYHYAKNEFKESLSAMKQAIGFKKGTATASDYVVLTYLYAENDSLDQIVKSLLIAAEKGMSRDKLQSKEMLAIKSQIGDDSWTKVIQGFEQAHLKYKSKLDLDYRLAIEFLMGGDQVARYAMKFAPNDLNYFDSLTFSRLVKLIDEKGFPNIAKHGFDGSKLEAFMLHYSVDSPLKFMQVLDILEKANKQELFGNNFIAVVIDRYNMRTGIEPQVYGVWTLWQDRKNGIFSPISNIESIDETRFTRNLLRLNEQAEAENLKLPENYIAIDYPPNYFCGFQHTLD
jgi:hypothetical protein